MLFQCYENLVKRGVINEGYSYRTTNVHLKGRE